MTQGCLELRVWMREQKLTQLALAEMLKVPQGYVSRWWRGLSQPSLDNAVKIHALTGIKPEAWTKRASRDALARELSARVA